jgi:hypothetical protein
MMLVSPGNQKPGPIPSMKKMAQSRTKTAFDSFLLDACQSSLTHTSCAAISYRCQS